MEKIITIKPVYVGVAPCSYCEGGQRKQEEERFPDVVNGSGKEKKNPRNLVQFPLLKARIPSSWLPRRP